MICTVLGEEWGCVGGMLLGDVCKCLLLRGVNVARSCRDKLGARVGFGITATVFGNVAVNIAMVLGMLPVVGIPIPMVSNGGSSAVVTMASVGILLNVAMRKFVFQK